MAILHNLKIVGKGEEVPAIPHAGRVVRAGRSDAGHSGRRHPAIDDDSAGTFPGHKRQARRKGRQQ